MADGDGSAKLRLKCSVDSRTHNCRWGSAVQVTKRTHCQQVRHHGEEGQETAGFGEHDEAVSTEGKIDRCMEHNGEQHAAAPHVQPGEKDAEGRD